MKLKGLRKLSSALLVFLLAAALLFSLAGCTSPQDTHQKNTYQVQISTQTQSNEKDSSRVIEKPEQDQISQLTNNKLSKKKKRKTKLK